MADTARDMLAMLRRHYLPEGRQPGGIFAPEIAAPNSMRRADLIWQGVTSGSGYGLVGHEIKVNRADLLAELADPTKSDPWQKYCNQWWLVIPHASLLDGLELPPTWGVLTPPSGRRTRSCTIARPAPTLSPHDQGPAWLTLATWLHWRHHTADSNLRSTSEQLRVAREQADHLRRQVPATSGTASAEQELVAEIIRKLGGAHFSGIGDWDREIKTEDVVDALTNLGLVQKKAADADLALKYRRDELRRLGQRIEQILKEDAA